MAEPLQEAKGQESRKKKSFLLWRMFLKVLFTLVCRQGSTSLRLTPPEVQSLIRAFKSQGLCRVTIGKAGKEHDTAQPFLPGCLLGACQAHRRPNSARGWACGGPEELKPKITGGDGPCSFTKMILVKGKLRRETISLLPDDASLLWHELDLRLICPVSVCPLTTAQLSASLPSNLLVYSKRMFCLKQGSRKSGETWVRKPGLWPWGCQFHLSHYTASSISLV